MVATGRIDSRAAKRWTRCWAGKVTTIWTAAAATIISREGWIPIPSLAEKGMITFSVGIAQIQNMAAPEGTAFTVEQAMTRFLATKMLTKFMENPETIPFTVAMLATLSTAAQEAIASTEIPATINY